MNRAGRCISAACLLIVAALAPCGVAAHGGLQTSSPVPGAALGDSPSAVRLTFTERPEAALSEIRVLDTQGVPRQTGRPVLMAGDPLTLTVRVPPLPDGIYTVSWRIVSAVDGHSTSGTFAFGVRVSPEGGGSTPADESRSSRLEIVARATLIAGAIVLLGACCAGIARFGGGRELPVAGVGWITCVAGLLLLAFAQQQHAAVPLRDFLGTSIGRALVHRAIALATAGVALAFARSLAGRWHRVAVIVCAIAAAALIVVHAAAGHAAAGPWPAVVATIASQFVHFAAAAVWAGGLAALLVGLRGSSPTDGAAAVRRFSNIAAGCILLVAVTGVTRSTNELTAWRELTSTPYGRFVLAKATLFGMIAVLGAINRWRNVATAATDLGPLRRAGGAELVLMAGAMTAAAALGTLPPPASARGLIGLTASGADFGTSVRVRLTLASPLPGPNRFTVDALDYDSGDPVHAERVALTFTPLDDPGMTPSSLELRRAEDGSYVASGPNLAFAGRWRITVNVQHSGHSVGVPIDIQIRPER